MSSSEIISICQQLSKEGKEPSVALIKARLSRPAPMPFVIAGLKQWRANPDMKVEQQDEGKEPKSAQNQSLEQRVSALELEVKELKQLIKQLVESE